jgi:ABC-type glycerol-3-phosphate transport system substrate-binding protein
VVIQDLTAGISVPTTTLQPQFYQLWLDMEDAILYEKMKPKEAVDSYAKRGQALLDEWNAKRKK